MKENMISELSAHSCHLQNTHTECTKKNAINTTEQKKNEAFFFSCGRIQDKYINRKKKRLG